MEKKSFLIFRQKHPTNDFLLRTNHMAEKTPTRSTQNNFQWKTIITWVVLAILLRWQVIEPRWIPSGSMLPTLQIQDRILIEKIRPRILKKQNKSIKNESIVVFKPPKALIEAGYDSK